MLRRYLLLILLVALASCVQAPIHSSEPGVNSDLVAGQENVTDVKGIAHEVAASRDAEGVQSDFVVGLLRLRHVSTSDLQAFLARYGGTVVSDDAVVEPPVRDSASQNTTS